MPDMEQTTLTQIIEFLQQHAPFDQMDEDHLTYLAKRLRLVFYPRDSIMTSPDAGVPENFYIIKQGRIRGEAQDGEEGGGWELTPGECFPIGALLARRPVQTIARAVEDSFCFELGRDGFDYLLQHSAVFHDFCTRRLANLLDNALRRIQARSASRIAEDNSLNTPLRQLLKRTVVTCKPDTPLRDALQTMQQEHIGSMVVTDQHHGVAGIFTLHDLLKWITQDESLLDVPIHQVMTPDPLVLPADAMAHEAALLMARHGFGHICVVERGHLLGMISERDIFSLQRVGIASLGQAIARATTVAQLAPLGHDIHRLVEQMLAQGASVEQLTRLIAALNDNLTRRVITLMLEQHDEPLPPFVWLAFGSEGRSEQTLKTDQDNGILFLAQPNETTEQTRQRLLPLARRINDALAECGFPLCPGNIMASNPECCLSLDEWRRRFERWIDQGTPEHLLKATIFFDFRPLHGDGGRIEPLRLELLKLTGHNSRFRRQLAANAMQFRPPLGLFGEFKLSSSGDEAHTLDLKLQGLTPFVDAARIIALANGISETNTEARLQAAAEAGTLRQADVAAWCEAYHYIQLLRMRNHRQQAKRRIVAMQATDSAARYWKANLRLLVGCLTYGSWCPSVSASSWPNR
jgi:CBS domain-containing protein